MPFSVIIRRKRSRRCYPEFLFPDGLHPSLAGQKAIATALVERLGGECTESG